MEVLHTNSCGIWNFQWIVFRCHLFNVLLTEIVMQKYFMLITYLLNMKSSFASMPLTLLMMTWGQFTCYPDVDGIHSWNSPCCHLSCVMQANPKEWQSLTFAQPIQLLIPMVHTPVITWAISASWSLSWCGAGLSPSRQAKATSDTHGKESSHSNTSSEGGMPH